MLIDFSDALLTPVRTLAQVFMRLVRSLSLQVPNVDPSLFMERFAGEMNLGSKTSAVAETGVRLVQAMARDWLATGRRPLGLCAASLLIATRYHGTKVNAEDISSIFRVCPGTVHKRLAEFKMTATAALPLDKFETTDLLSLPILKAPPCVNRKTKRKMLALEDETDPCTQEEDPLRNGAHEQFLALDHCKRTAISLDIPADELCRDVRAIYHYFPCGS